MGDSKKDQKEETVQLEGHDDDDWYNNKIKKFGH
jgi:hypothetical protein